MDMGNFNLFIKMLEEEYKLTSSETLMITRRLLADDREFEKIWRLYRNKTKSFKGGVDNFKATLLDLLT